MICTHCHKTLIWQRSTKRFCSAKCRVYASRKALSVTNNFLSVTVSVTKQPLSVTKPTNVEHLRVVDIVPERTAWGAIMPSYD